jgi:hypothetical protein
MHPGFFANRTSFFTAVLDPRNRGNDVFHELAVRRRHASGSNQYCPVTN